MKVTVCGPNLRDQSKGTFHVHAAGCADLKRGARKDIAYRDGWTIDAETRVDVAEDVYDNGIMQEDETGADYLFDFYFFPCCAALPVGAGVAA